MILVPFRPEHLDGMDTGEIETGEDMEAFRQVIRNAEGPAKTFMDEKPIGAFGILRAGNDGYSWAVFTDELRGKPFALHRMARRELREAAKEFETVYGTVRMGWKQGQRWLKAMGFERDGTFDLPTGEVERWVLQRQS